MDLSTVISQNDLLNLTRGVEHFNKSINQGRQIKQSLDKDDFLKILLTQLTHQDPTRPMEDKEFIAQMAQFSSLEQMNNMNSELSKVLNLLARGQALAMLGKTVEILAGEGRVTGVVEEISGSEYPQLLVEGKFYDISQITSVSVR